MQFIPCALSFSANSRLETLPLMRSNLSPISLLHLRRSTYFNGINYVDLRIHGTSNLPYWVYAFDVTPATVIGFLTILGYSLYDTVVVFDKIRENTRTITASSKSTYSQATNLAVNQTIVRSFNTSLIALLPVGSILFVGAGLLGAGTLKDLSLALFIGLAVGTYSSVFIAPPVLAQLREKEPEMIALAKRVEARASSNSSVKTVAVASGETRGPRNQPKRKGRK